MPDQKPPEPEFDLVQYAYEKGVAESKAGPGFVNPYPPGTPQHAAWKRGWDETPRGVPQMSGPRGRSEADFIAGVPRPGPGKPKDVCEQSGLSRIEELARQNEEDQVSWAHARGFGDRARGRLLEGNPFLFNREGEQERYKAWEQGWLERDRLMREDAGRAKEGQAEQMRERLKAAIEKNQINPEPLRWVIPGPSLEQVALAVFPMCLKRQLAHEVGVISAEWRAVNNAFDAAEAFVAELERRRASKTVDDVPPVG